MTRLANSLGDDLCEGRGERVQVLVGRLVAHVEPGLELVVQLVEVAQEEAAVQRPAAHPQRTRLPLDQLKNSHNAVSCVMTGVQA